MVVCGIHGAKALPLRMGHQDQPVPDELVVHHEVREQPPSSDSAEQG